MGLAVAASFGPFEATASSDIVLKAAPATVDLVGGKWPPTAVWAYGGTVPGPLIRAPQGSRLRVRAQNGLGEPTTVHWHGIRLPHAMDGVPYLTQPPIEAGGTFDYAFDLPDAGTYWYHPHVRSSEQVGRGLYGAIIVDEPNPPKVDKDILWVLDDWRLDQSAAITNDFGHGMDLSHAGRFGNTVTINGKVTGDTPLMTPRAGERIRLRLLNTANARTFALTFENTDVRVIALDGHPVTPHTPFGGRIVLGSGQRAELILDISAKPGERTRVIDNYFARDTYLLGEIVLSQRSPVRTSALDAPVALTPNPLAEPDIKNAKTHDISLDGGAMGRMTNAIYKGREVGVMELMRAGKAWTINGVAADRPDMDPFLTLEKGQSHILRLHNNTGWPHPIHMHGVAFRLLSLNGKPHPHKPWLDTIFFEPGDRAEVALVADNPGDWLFHCHILEHHQAGMAGVIRIA